MFKQFGMSILVSLLQAAVTSGAGANFLKQLLSALTNQPTSVQSITMPTTPPSITLSGEILKVKHADGREHDVNLSGL